MTDISAKILEELAKLLDKIADECKEASNNKVWKTSVRRNCQIQESAYRDSAAIVRKFANEQTSSVVAP
jgi:hypothetical protein